jgi:putative flavoprotein involved in K+ transport
MKTTSRTSPARSTLCIVLQDQERARVGETWRGLWDSFCLVTPNWTMCLPGAPYAGDDPEGFVPRREIVRYLERDALTFDLPVREGVAVESLEPAESGGFLLRTSAGDLHAGVVVVCTGAAAISPRSAPKSSTLKTSAW